MGLKIKYSAQQLFLFLYFCRIYVKWSSLAAARLGWKWARTGLHHLRQNYRVVCNVAS